MNDLPNEILLKIFEYVFNIKNEYTVLLLNKKLTNSFSPILY